MSCNFLTETDESPWRDCLYASGVMLAWDAGRSLPYGLSKAEREALESSDDRPDEQGGTLEDLMTGFRRRYGWTPLLRKEQANAGFLSGLSGGSVVTILYSALPVHYQRWDTSFAGTGPLSRHAVNVRRSSSVDGSTRSGYLWLRDPLGRGDYCGEWITEADILRAANARNGGAKTVDSIQAVVVRPPDNAGDAMAGLRLQLDATNTPTAPWTSFYRAKVRGTKHAAVCVSDKSYLAVADGLDLGIVQVGSLLAPLEAQVGQPPIAGDRTSIVAVDIKNGSKPAEQYVLLRSDVTLTPWTPPATDCTAAVAAATVPLNAQIATLTGRIATIKGKVAANAADISDD